MNKILVAIDGADHSEKTVKSAAEIARKNDGSLVILYTCSQDSPSRNQLDFAEKNCGKQFRNLVTGKELPAYAVADGDGEKSISEYMNAREKLCNLYGSDVLERASSVAKTTGINAVETRMERGDVTKTILDVATSENADTIVVGNCNKNALSRLLTGCTAREVLKKANCTAVVVD